MLGSSPRRPTTFPLLRACFRSGKLVASATIWAAPHENLTDGYFDWLVDPDLGIETAWWSDAYARFECRRARQSVFQGSCHHVERRGTRRCEISTKSVLILSATVLYVGGMVPVARSSGSLEVGPGLVVWLGNGFCVLAVGSVRFALGESGSECVDGGFEPACGEAIEDVVAGSGRVL